MSLSGSCMVTHDRQLCHLGFQCEVRGNSSSFYLDTLNDVHVQKAALLGNIPVPIWKHVFPQPVNQNYKGACSIIQFLQYFPGISAHFLFILHSSLAQKAGVSFYTTKSLMVTGWQTRTILTMMGIKKCAHILRDIFISLQIIIINEEDVLLIEEHSWKKEQVQKR